METNWKTWWIFRLLFLIINSSPFVLLFVPLPRISDPYITTYLDPPSPTGCGELGTMTRSINVPRSSNPYKSRTYCILTFLIVDRIRHRKTLLCSSSRSEPVRPQYCTQDLFDAKWRNGKVSEIFDYILLRSEERVKKLVRKSIRHIYFCIYLYTVYLTTCEYEDDCLLGWCSCRLVETDVS
jgi:hypothetical protein